MKKGFTLIELIVVIAIIAVLAAVVAPSAFKAIEKGKVSAGMGDWDSIKTASFALFADTSTWPADGTTGAGLTADTAPATPGWDGPYLEKWPSRNPWAGTYTMQNDAAIDWDGGGVDNAVYLHLTNVPATDGFTRLDNQVDNADGAAAGSVQYTAATSDLFLLISIR